MSLSLNNSTIVPLLSGEIFLGKEYDNILDFAEIDIAIKCDVGYTLTYIYSQDKLSIDYSTSQAISAQINTQFYKIPVNDRYFKLKIEATDGDMSVLNVQTIYKSVPTFNNSGDGPVSNVSISSPLNGDGSVRVGGSLTIGGSVSVSNFPATQPVSGSVNVTNTNLDVTVSNFPATQPVSGSVNVGNFPATQPVSGSVSVSNFPATQPVSGSVNVTNTNLDVTVSNFPATQPVSGSVSVSNFPATQPVSGSVSITNSSIPVTNAKLDNLQFDAFNNLNMNLNNLNSNFLDVGNNNGLKVAVQNSSLAVTNASLSSMAFTSNKLNVIDADANTKLTNIYNVINSRGSSELYNGSIVNGGYTNVLNLSSVNVSNLTIYGTQDINGNKLTVLFSNDSITFYPSQYSYTCSTSGGFGFNITCCPKYMAIQVQNACNLLLFVDYC